jgi:hypothetical protein
MPVRYHHKSMAVSMVVKSSLRYETSIADEKFHSMSL